MKRLLASIAFFAMLIAESAAEASPPVGWPGDTWSCAGYPYCLKLDDQTTYPSTFAALELHGLNGRTLYSHAANGGAGLFLMEPTADSSSWALRSYNQGAGIGLSVGSVTGIALDVLANGGGVGVQVKALGNDAISIAGPGSVGIGHSALYCAPGNDTWCAYLVGSSMSKPALFVANGSGPAIRAQGSAGGNFPWIVYSDVTLKTRLADSPFGLATVLRMRPITYYWTDQRRGADQQIGFSAQELAALNIPGLVVTDPETKKLMAAYGPMDAVLVAAIKELTARVAALEAKVSPVPPPNVPGL
jgi:hypothetical protein